ncbi:hypothetical protein BBO99_00001320 [Phytophthora kernoviae]|uniref:BZIP domain-containing protein n=1 Tax=Phytophthora kernoviae TaxID=325452 RepID=A0A3R7K324_9STRA|nr:hypothetical protein JM16_001976 [Phytophthora kernoviae]RLN10290.1 hypothetical protein BBI17_001191 [Phytophthora kernoviae]RLN84435.1 hypothetical protein BBO99_00001320 [Phytophthora kernoviae]
MKREAVFPVDTDANTTSDDWGSGAAAILDDVMWDEESDLSPPQTGALISPMDIVCSASPVNSPAGRVYTLDRSGGGGISPICGDESPIDSQHRGSLLLFDIGDDFGLGFNPGTGSGISQLSSWGMVFPAIAPNEAARTVSKPVANASTTQITYGKDTDQALESTQLSSDSALERRRQKNRDCMRKARQKQRDELHAMKITVERLEKQYAELNLRSSNAVSNVSETIRAATSSSDSGALVARSRVALEYSQAVDLSRRLSAENLYLKAEIQQQQAWKLNLSRILQSSIEVDGPRWAQQFQQPSLGGEEVLRMQLDKMDELDASEELGYHALSDLDLTHVILENQRTIGRVQSRLFVPSSLDTEGGTRTRRMQTFGWDMVQRVDGNIMECVFTKKFHGLNVAGLMQKTWANDMRLGEFKKVKGETCRLEVLQQVNPNAYVLCRDVMSPTQDISIFRSVYVRFLIETSKKIPASSGVSSSGTGIDASAPSTPPQYAESDSDCEELMLEATGYVLGTQSVDTDHSRHPRAEDMFNKVAWAHLSLSIEFLNVVNPVTVPVQATVQPRQLVPWRPTKRQHHSELGIHSALQPVR